jgi:protein required for attachment to host cells
MSQTGEQGKVPPPLLDEDDNLIVVEDSSNTETFTAPTVEELMKQLEKLNAEVKRLNAKDKKGKKHSSSSKDDDSLFEEEASNNGKKESKKRDKSSYNAMSFNYDNMPSSTAYTSVHIGKAPYFDGSNYNQWKHCMKKNYIPFHPKYGKLFVMV